MLMTSSKWLMWPQNYISLPSGVSSESQQGLSQGQTHISCTHRMSRSSTGLANYLPHRQRLRWHTPSRYTHHPRWPCFGDGFLSALRADRNVQTVCCLWNSANKVLERSNLKAPRRKWSRDFGMLTSATTFARASIGRSRHNTLGCRDWRQVARPMVKEPGARQPTCATVSRTCKTRHAHFHETYIIAAAVIHVPRGHRCA
eukprot:3377105-Pleurochrysis_carterae.AAC.2